MSQIIVIENFPASNIAELTSITSDASAAQAVVNVENIGSIVVNDYLLIGEKGQENAQIAKVSSISSLAITLNANLTTKHYRGEKVYKIRANQVKIYRADNVDGSLPADGSFSVLATSDIKSDAVYTEYVDATGGSDYWYKYTFYNFTSTAESSIADAVGVRGGNYGYYVTSEEVRQEAGMSNNRWIADTLVFEKIQLAQSEVNSVLVSSGYSLPFTEVPGLVKNATLMLAAGYLMIADYGPEFEGLNKDGNNKLTAARTLLDKIKAKSADLVESDGTTVARENDVRGYPDSTAATLSTPEDFSFKVTDVY